MKRCLRLLLPAGLMLLLLGTIAAACSSDDEITLEEFYEQRQAIADEYRPQFDEALESFPDDGEETDENLQAEKAYYSEVAALWDDVFDELETLNPPSEVEDEFDEFLAAGRDNGEFSDEFADSVDGVESYTELAELYDEIEAETEALNESYRASCQSLQEVADANSIVADIGCADSAF